jgi:predicted nucleic acid-binding Zn ribbon protein
MPAVRLPPHRHCLQCDDPIPEEDSFCSEECERKYTTKKTKSRRKTIYLYVGTMAALIILAIVSASVRF